MDWLPTRRLLKIARRERLSRALALLNVWSTLRTYLGIYAWVLTTSVSSNNGINSHSLRVPLLVVLFYFGFSEERIKTKPE